MKVVAVVQARMGSTRLPGKVLKPLGGKSVLEHVLLRVSRARRVDQVVLATTVEQQDSILVDIAQALGVSTVRGSVRDVLSRFILATEMTGADHVVRVTADCPCIDPDVIDRVVMHHISSQCDYTSNTRPRTFPHGLDVEVVTATALTIADRQGATEAEREHVTPFIRSRPHQFRLGNVEARPDETMPDLRVTLDTAEDYIVLQAIFDLAPNEDFHAAELVKLVAAHPWISSINRNVRQKLPPVAEPAPLRIRQEICEAAKWACSQELYWAAALLLESLSEIDRLASRGPFSPEAVKAKCLELNGEIGASVGRGATVGDCGTAPN